MGIWKEDDENMSVPFFQIPQVLFEPEYRNLSANAKLLYALLLNREFLSEKNGVRDKNGNTVVFFSNAEVCEKLSCGHDKATNCFRQLEINGLIRRKKQGKGKPDIIYVENVKLCEKSARQTEEKSYSAMLKNRSQKCGKAARNYKDIKYNDNSNINQSTYKEVEEDIKDQIEYDVLFKRGYGEVLNEIVNLLTDTYCVTQLTVKIGKRQISTETVRYRFSKLTAEHIEEVIRRLNQNTETIKNMRAYLLVLIYYSIDCTEADGLFAN